MSEEQKLNPEEYSEARKEAQVEIVAQPEKKTGFGKAMYTPCSVCKEKKYTREEVYKKRIEKYGSEEALHANYRCRECRKK